MKPTRVWLLLAACTLGSFAQSVMVTGPPAPSLAGYDALITNLMSKYGIPGAELAVTRNGQLVLAHGYGWSDQANQIPMQPDMQMRIASCSKQFTSVAILQLVQQGKLSLDDKAFSILSDIQPLPGAAVDPRIANITIRNLLQHSGGWNRDIPPFYDPMFDDVNIAAKVGIASPPSTTDVIRYMLGRPLDFTPGSAYDYSNFGYAVLGRVIEKVAGMNYEQYVRSQVMAPAGIDDMHVGQTLAQGRQANETKYYMQSGDTPVSSVFSFVKGPLAWPYGGWYMEKMDSHGAWIASAIDLVKFWNAIDGRRGKALLTTAAVAQMTARPDIPDWASTSYWYGMGFLIRPAGANANWWHDGSLDGTRAWVVRANDGYAWAAIFNLRLDKAANDNNFTSDLDNGLWNVKAAVTNWPTGDLFPNYAPHATPLPAITGQGGVVDGATYQRGIIPGSWVSIFGANMAPRSRLWGLPDFNGSNLPLSLDGVSVTFDGTPAPVFYISPGQLNVQAPAGLKAGPTVVQVSYNGMSNVVVAEVRAVSPGLYAYGAAGVLFAAGSFVDGVTTGDVARVPGTRAPKPGDPVQLFASGLQSAPSGMIISTPVDLTLPTVRVGSQLATVTYAGLVGAGLFQINITTPNLPDGDYPVSITASGVKSLTSPILAIRH
jgi:N-acyl-D-amino-acid deacylase